MTRLSATAPKRTPDGRDFEQVSCVLVTQEGRLRLFERSLRCYLAQDYPSRQLVVVTAAGRRYRDRLAQHLKQVGATQVTLVAAPRLTLGSLRGIGVSRACGPLVCQWDDDDLNHPHRLTAQVAVMRRLGARASFLHDHLHFFQWNRKLYWCNWERSVFHTGHPGTLLAYKDALPPYDTSLQRGEDTAVQQAMLKAHVPTIALTGLGHLYMYVCHGNNTFSVDHHRLIARKYGIEAATITDRLEKLRSALVSYELAPPVTVVDHMAREVFVWSSRHGPPESLAEKGSCTAAWVSGPDAGSTVTVDL